MLLSLLLRGYPYNFLAFNACYASLPQRVRLSPEVSQAVDVARCFLSDGVVRLFERLDGAPYLVVILVTSRLGDVRCRFVKHLAAAKLKLPFALVVRLLPRAQDSCEGLLHHALRHSTSNLKLPQVSRSIS
jgi:hypothetical protein